MKVFHELARHLQTRRLIAGDTLQLDQDKNFYCVVDGLVQVYAHSGVLTSNHPEAAPSAPHRAQNNSADYLHGQQAHGTASGSDAWDADDMNGYHLLNEVGSGGTLSSLFTILSLFTENVNLAWPDEEDGEEELNADGLHPEYPRQPTAGPPSESNATIIGNGFSRSDILQRARASSDVSQLDLSSSAYQDGQHSPSLQHDQLLTSQDWESIASPTSGNRSLPSSTRPSGPSSRLPSGTPSLAPSASVSGRGTPLLSESRRDRSDTLKVPGRPSMRMRQSTIPAGLAGARGSIARASVDTTLAVIPAGECTFPPSSLGLTLISRFVLL